MKEVETIMKQRLIKIDGKTRTDTKFPTGFMDVVQIEKTGENFRIIYDVKGRFTVHRWVLETGNGTLEPVLTPASPGSPPPRRRTSCAACRA